MCRPSSISMSATGIGISIFWLAYAEVTAARSTAHMRQQQPTLGPVLPTALRSIYLDLVAACLRIWRSGRAT